jgi:hypothetical protein
LSGVERGVAGSRGDFAEGLSGDLLGGFRIGRQGDVIHVCGESESPAAGRDDVAGAVSLRGRGSIEFGFVKKVALDAESSSEGIFCVFGDERTVFKETRSAEINKSTGSRTDSLVSRRFL